GAFRKFSRSVAPERFTTVGWAYALAARPAMAISPIKLCVFSFIDRSPSKWRSIRGAGRPRVPRTRSNASPFGPPSIAAPAISRRRASSSHTANSWRVGIGPAVRAPALLDVVVARDAVERVAPEPATDRILHMHRLGVPVDKREAPVAAVLLAPALAG